MIERQIQKKTHFYTETGWEKHVGLAGDSWVVDHLWQPVTYLCFVL